MVSRIEMTPVRRQKGAALIIALIMLLVMTVLGIAAMGVTRMEERMAGNARDVDLAFQASEAGLRDGEARVRAATGLQRGCTGAPCNIWRENMLNVDFRTQALSWWNTNGREYGTAGSQDLVDVTRDPVVVVEVLEILPDSLGRGRNRPPRGREYYKITSNAAGASSTANVMLESTYVKRYP
jgi:type IV pilus assembly protein PilX